MVVHGNFLESKNGSGTITKCGNKPGEREKEGRGEKENWLEGKKQMGEGKRKHKQQQRKNGGGIGGKGQISQRFFEGKMALFVNLQMSRGDSWPLLRGIGHQT